MNYYTRHLGDYARDTGLLSVLEHGVYTLLLDRYYTTEAGIPDGQVYRMARARSDAEKAAVDAVLADFFQLVEGVWINRRAEEELEKAAAKIQAAVGNGKKGGRPAKNPTETRPVDAGFSPQNPGETQPKAHQTPNTKHQTPVLKHTHSGYAESAGEIEIAGSVCVALRELGILQTNPHHADLLQLIRDGTSLEEFVSAGAIAAGKNKGFAYALGVAKTHRQETSNRNHHVHTLQEHGGSQIDRQFAEKYAGIG